MLKSVTLVLFSTPDLSISFIYIYKYISVYCIYLYSDCVVCVFSTSNTSGASARYPLAEYGTENSLSIYSRDSFFFFLLCVIYFILFCCSVYGGGIGLIVRYERRFRLSPMAHRSQLILYIYTDELASIHSLSPPQWRLIKPPSSNRDRAVINVSYKKRRHLYAARALLSSWPIRLQ